MEQWAQIEAFPRYSVSDHGRIRNDATDRIMKQTTLQSGHLIVGLMTERGQDKRGVARLVARAFVPNPNPERFDTTIHLDGNEPNCHAANLMWRPRWFSTKFKRQFSHLDHPASHFHRPIRDMQTQRVYQDVWEIVMEKGLLWHEIVVGIEYNMYTFPNREYFQWA